MSSHELSQSKPSSSWLFKSGLVSSRQFVSKLYSFKFWVFGTLCLLLCLIIKPPAETATAKIWLPSIFADNMILQRDIPIPIWGTARPGLKLKIKLGSNEVDTTSGIDGNWSAKLPAMPAGGSYDLSVLGSDSIIFHNVAIGDVWFCAGQSNMQMPIHLTFNYAEDVQTANYPMVRFFQVEQSHSAEPERNASGQWQRTTPKTVSNFSAVAYYFARELHQNTKIPIGIIECTSVETIITTWMSKTQLAGLHKYTKSDSLVFNGMVAPIIGFGIKGVVWYKGESDHFEALEYQKLLSGLVQDWRQKWNQGSFPWFCIQLPNYPSPDNYSIDSSFAQIREAQLQCSKCIPNFHLVVTIDTTEKTAGIHPQNKIDIGHRLARMALSRIYEHNHNVYSPSCESMKIVGNKMVLHFSPKGLVAKNKEINGFVLAGADQVFYPASAHIAASNSDVIVWSDKVTNPIAARYAWADNPKCNLYDNNNLPLSPFRTDSWGLTSCTKTLTASYWLKKAYSSKLMPPDIVILGNEQLFALQGADAYIYSKPIDITGDHQSRILECDLTRLLNEDLRIVIGALPDALVSDQLVVSHALFLSTYKPKLVAIALSPLSFIDANCSSLDTTEPFTFFSKDIGFDLNLFFNQLKLPSIWYARLTSFLNRQNEVSKDFKTDCRIGNFSPLSWHNQSQRIYPGQLVISSTDGYKFQDNLKEYQRRYGNTSSSQLDIQMSCLNSLLSYLSEQQIKTVVFNVPLTDANKKLLPNSFWNFYDNHISEICRKNEADYISLDRVVLPFKENEFVDGAHLNLIGGLRLSKTIAIFIANKFGQKTFQELLANDKYLL